MSAIQFINIIPEEFMKELGEMIDERLRRQLKHINASSDEELLTHQEAAKFLKVSPNTLHRHKEKCKIKFYRTGNRLKYKRSDLLEFLKRQNQEPS